MDRNDNKKICFLGSGNMAEAIIKGIIDKKIISSENILCVDVSGERLNYMQSKYKTDILNLSDTKNFQKLAEISIYILSIKPNNASEILSILQKFVDSKSLIVSIMAGIKIEKIKNLLAYDGNLQIVRVMPNTAALVGKCASGYSCNENVSTENKIVTEKILSAIGVCENLDEKYLDAVTALSGSGPAYVFYLAEAMISAGIEMGLSDDISKKLTIQTIYGAADMLKNSDDSPEILRQKVTSKGGTTQAATTYFDDNNLKTIVKNALQKAKEKSIELSK